MAREVALRVRGERERRIDRDREKPFARIVGIGDERFVSAAVGARQPREKRLRVNAHLSGAFQRFEVARHLRDDHARAAGFAACHRRQTIAPGAERPPGRERREVLISRFVEGRPLETPEAGAGGDERKRREQEPSPGRRDSEVERIEGRLRIDVPSHPAPGDLPGILSAPPLSGGGARILISCVRAREDSSFVEGAWRKRLYIQVPGPFAQKGGRDAAAVSDAIKQQAQDAVTRAR